uniref:Sushi domain-containing protein n=1 Tax=Aquila chrysaetos chrysaetos TaxID=223781 RepID=A0A663FEA6_AQUCH
RCFSAACSTHCSCICGNHKRLLIVVQLRAPALKTSEIEFFCDEGYELIGDVSWTCQKSGKWSKKQSPKCVPTKCPEPPLAENQLVLREVTYQVGVVQFSCKEGYVLHGSSVLKCLPSQQWNDSFPFCKVVQCPAPPYIPFGDPLTSSLHFGSTVKYICVDGFLLKGESTIRCQADGSWSLPLPECIPVECPQPEEIQNGIVTGEEYTFQRHTEYSCNEGFVLDGDRSRVCLANGSWSGIAPVCKAVTCPVPLPLPNGRTSGSDFGFKKEVHYHCNEGYSLQGVSMLTCQSDGTWDSEAPRCEPVICGPPEDISHGFLNGSGFTYGEFAQYVCFPGYELHGNPLRQCLSNGSWSGSLPSCLPCLCPTPQIQNGFVLGTDFSCGKSAQFQCLEGFKLPCSHAHIKYYLDHLTVSGVCNFSPVLASHLCVPSASGACCNKERLISLLSHFLYCNTALSASVADVKLLLCPV